MLHYENEYVQYWLKNKIVHITYKKDVTIDLNGGIQIVKDRLKLHRDEFLPVLCDIRGIKEISKSARDYLANEGSTLVKTVALIIEPPVSELLSEFYLRTSKPLIPTKLFEEIPMALIYLDEFL
ncbi:DUF7793 family protein [Flavivirga rizhaonensis]|uniref:DUF7793 domain-containing protein n=1 Tax=Flavivirga rizhaonensis TaxID=2559571 RepID=A0A4S1DZD0_9FLAO|nr:hypothetical protein [Flavivirga rizhaonensis]TGV03616.1 hypothetical protein EM932_06210 [Flavivirga rizhaonensis]